jgi:ferrochelatase
MTRRARVGVILLQLGTPEAPTTPALRAYLREFLSDTRVIDLPRALWLPILYLRVLRTRPAASARLYAKVWTPEGSPLAVTTRRQAEGVESRLASVVPGLRVVVGMRYGKPSIADAVRELVESGCDRILAVPMYPQYAGATTGSSVERLFEELTTLRVVPTIRVVPPYFDAAEYVAALADVTRRALDGIVPDRVLLSFHGLPKRYAELGDPYPDHCRATAEALTAAMRWPKDRVTVAFQSRFGREEWLRPYTDEVLAALAPRGLPLVAVLCPGFTADCLETLEEIGMTNREKYEELGGGGYRLVPCLNDDPVWLDALAALVSRELTGWF